jgi:hypothetical protein
MALTRLVSLLRDVEDDLARALSGSPRQLARARMALLDLLIAVEIPPPLSELIEQRVSRGLRRHVAALREHLESKSRIPEALCAHYRYRQSRGRVLSRYRVSATDWSVVHRLAEDLSCDLAGRTGMVPYGDLPWHDDLEQEIVSVEAILDPRAFEDVLVCALEGYLSPRKRKGYEIYGVMLGMVRDEVHETRGRGTSITRFVSMTRGQPQMSAASGPQHVEPSQRSVEALREASAVLFPQYQITGDFHSHVYDDVALMMRARGWEPSDVDTAYSYHWTRRMREAGDRPQVDLVVAIARSPRRVRRSHHAGLANTIQTSVGDCRVVIGAHRILTSGHYTQQGVHLIVPGAAE